MSKPIKLENWKSEFKNNEVFVLKGIGFYVAAVTRRGLALRKAKQPNTNEKTTI